MYYVTHVLKESLLFRYEGDLPPPKVMHEIGEAWGKHILGWGRSEVALVVDAITQYFS